MSENRLRRLADELTADLAEYRRLQSEVTDALSRFSDSEPDHFELRAIGSILHDVYHGAESICRYIAKEIDRGVPTGANWHRLLLDQMAQPLPKTRPAVIQSKTVSLLEAYRTFRHVFRNIYGSELDWSQMEPLLENAIIAINAFTDDMEQFTAFLRLMGTDNESLSET